MFLIALLILFFIILGAGGFMFLRSKDETTNASGEVQGEPRGEPQGDDITKLSKSISKKMSNL